VYFIGDANNFGLLSQAVIPAIYKRSAMNNWSNYVRLAGNNFERIVYRGGVVDPIRRLEAVNALQVRQARVMDFTDDMEYKVENLSSSQQNALFKEHTEYLDTMMTRLILGQTMTTQDGSSRSQAEVHERTQETVTDADAKMVLDTLNFDLYEMFVKLYGLPAGGRWQWVENAGTKQLQQIEFDLKLKELGVVFTDQELRAKYGL
jgi:phage gp29-like protein